MYVDRIRFDKTYFSYLKIKLKRCEIFAGLLTDSKI